MPVTHSCCGLVQIQHAGEGGIYAELIQDRTFSGLAYTQVLLLHRRRSKPLESSRELRACSVLRCTATTRPNDMCRRLFWTVMHRSWSWGPAPLRGLSCRCTPAYTLRPASSLPQIYPLQALPTWLSNYGSMLRTGMVLYGT